MKDLVVSNENQLSAYLNKVSKIKMLSAEEEYDLAVKWKEEANNQAAQLLMISYLPLVVKIAYSYKNYGQSIPDLISEGNLGLMRAIYKFNPYKGFRLATYAMWWIKAYISEYILNSWSIVKSGSALGRKKLFFSLRKMKQKLGITTKSMSDEQITNVSTVLNTSKEDVIALNNMLEQKDVSLEAPLVNTDGYSTYGDILPDCALNPEEVISSQEETQFSQTSTVKVLKNLNPRERFIIEQRFLIENPRTLNDIGVELNLSRERVRQIEQKALKKAKTYLLSSSK